MKPLKNTGIALLCMGSGLVGLALEDHSDLHYFGCGTIFGLGANILGSSVASIVNKRGQKKSLTGFLTQ